MDEMWLTISEKATTGRLAYPDLFGMRSNRNSSRSSDFSENRTRYLLGSSPTSFRISSRQPNKIPPRLLADIIQDLFSDDEDHAKRSALKWEEMKYYARKFVHITDVVKDENGNEVFDVESTFPTRYPKGSWIPLLQNVKNVTMTGIIPPNHRKSEALWRWEDDEYANAGYGLRSVCSFSFVWYSG